MKNIPTRQLPLGAGACYYDQITGTIYRADLTLGNALAAGPQA